MDLYLDILGNNLLLHIILGIALGIITTIYIQIRSRRMLVLSLTYDITTTTLVKNSISQIEGLSIQYNKNIIRNLNSSTITLKNTGYFIIKSDDISSPLSLTTDGEFFIDSTKNNAINKRLPYSLEKNTSKNAIIHFNYLDKNDTISFSPYGFKRIYLIKTSDTFTSST